ncbi:MAG: phenylalanine--tRNA ligase subunit beta [Deltaproteobacteria bacterium]|jgi:phenylalanyl-tRNA synthetase beta chain|nr:phenylalanine--tRNA ligase subunit beta [Deltaproteobacteria bacterium]
MLLSLKWLREFVPYAGTAEELGATLTMLGLEMEELRRPYEDLADLLVGLVLERGPHPAADHLSVCKVDTGTEVLEIVCGAPNVGQGQYVAVAPAGARLPGGIRIRKARLRGVRSNGMICSERELGLSDEHGGIMVLRELAAGVLRPGQALTEALNLDTEVLDISVTPNRPDCLSVLGLAREVALACKLPLTLPALDREGVDCGGGGLEKLDLEVESGEISPFYQLRLIDRLKVRPAPAWMRWRLNACGQRPISNLVDVTNYVMLELGQPLHSFDFSRVRGGRVRVAPALEGEKLLTLDGQERILTSRDITIRDAEGPIGLAGVMGGAGTAIDESSTAVMLEGAVFDAASIYRTSRRLGLPSEAASRFAHGVDQAMTPFALERAALLIARLGEGRLGASPLTSALRPARAPALRLRKARAELLLGVPLEDSFCEETLRALGFAVQESGREEGSPVWTAVPPSYRPDIGGEADLVEELARVYGLDRIPEVIPRISRSLERAGLPESGHAFLTRVKNWASGAGLNETINYSFTGQEDLDFLGVKKDGRVGIVNPLSAEQGVLRPVLAPGLLQALRNNLAQGASGLRFFEAAAVFSADSGSPTGTGVREDYRLGFLLYGDRHAGAWPRKPEDAAYLDLKGLVEAFVSWLDLPEPEFVLSREAPRWLDQAAAVLVRGEYAGSLGRVKPELADAFHARKEVWLAELPLDKLRDLSAGSGLKFKALPLYPPVRRDITVIAPLGLESAALLKAIREARLEHLQEVFLLDLYAPEGSGERHLTYRLVFRHPERTLLDEEVDGIRNKAAKYLLENLKVRI